MIYLIIILLIISVLFFSLMRFPSPRTWWYSYNIQGPKGWPIIGNGIDFATTPLNKLLQYYIDKSIEFPRFTCFWILGVPTVTLYDSEDLEVLLSGVTNISKGIEYKALVPWLNYGLLMSTGSKWHKRRKMLTPAFHFRILDDNSSSINRHAQQLTKNMLKAKVFDAESMVKLCTLDVICETAMGISIRAQENEGKEYVEALKRIAEIHMKRVFTFWMYRDWIFYSLPIGQEFRKLVKFMHNFTEKVIAERKKNYEHIKINEEGNELNIKKRLAFLDLLIEWEMKNPNSLSEEDIREEVDTFMFEGHDTTSSALTFLLLCLGSYPDVQEKVVAELYSIFGDSDRNVELKDLTQMIYLEKVIKETMRLYSTVPFISRTITNDLILKDNTMIPAGVNLQIFPFVIHRNPKYYPEPEKFDPERFSETEIQKQHPFAFIPFSAGPRNCIGQKFAMMEIKVVISTILRKCIVTSMTDINKVKLLPLFVLRPDSPILIQVTPRETLTSY